MSILPLRHQSKQNGLRIRPFNFPNSSTKRRRINQKYVWFLAALIFYAIVLQAAFFIGKILGEYINSTDYDVVIIGAGWAGLKASKTLLDSGISSILILEANGYVGGRAKSINTNTNGVINSPDAVGNFHNIPTEMGCEWLYIGYGGMENDLNERGIIQPALVNDGNKRYSIDFYDAVYFAQTLNANGSVETNIIQENITNLQERVWDSFYAEEVTSNKNESYADAVESYKMRHNLSATEEHYLNLMKSIIEVENSADATKLSSSERISLRSHTHYTSIAGLGFGNIAGKYAEPFRSKIKLNANVIKVDHSDEWKNMVTYVQDGTTTKVSASNVLVTVPLGVLKANTIEFIPKFPEWKQEAIDNMGVGVLNKCIMYWNNPNDVVWPKDKFWFELMTPDEEISDRWTTFFNPTSFKNVPVLVGFISGHAAVDAESQSDDEILDDVMKNLYAMFPSIRKPDKTIITRWGKDETARGSYAFKKMNRSWLEDNKNLRKNIGRLWFAGEATFRTPGTTVAAWRTGEIAAESIASVLGY